jgi:small subunit ribosomal protein S17e
MGCVKPSYIKNFATELLEAHQDFGSDFEMNKEKVAEYTTIKNKTICNRVAGYITRVRSKSKGE